MFSLCFYLLVCTDSLPLCHWLGSEAGQCKFPAGRLLAPTVYTDDNRDCFVPLPDNSQQQVEFGSDGSSDKQDTNTGSSSSDKQDTGTGSSSSDKQHTNTATSSAIDAFVATIQCDANIDTFCDLWLSLGYECSDKYLKTNCATSCCQSQGDVSCAADVSQDCVFWTNNGWPCSDTWSQSNCATTCCVASQQLCAADLDRDCDYWTTNGWPCSDTWSQANCATTCCGVV